MAGRDEPRPDRPDLHTVRDAGYQRLLTRCNIRRPQLLATHHGLRLRHQAEVRYRSPGQAFQFLLDRLTALDLITWVREPGAIQVTVAGSAGRLLRTDG